MARESERQVRACVCVCVCARARSDMGARFPEICRMAVYVFIRRTDSIQPAGSCLPRRIGRNDALRKLQESSPRDHFADLPPTPSTLGEKKRSHWRKVSGDAFLGSYLGNLPLCLMACGIFFFFAHLGRNRARGGHLAHGRIHLWR
jgi:hypothetical protein